MARTRPAGQAQWEGTRGRLAGAAASGHRRPGGI